MPTRRYCSQHVALAEPRRLGPSIGRSKRVYRENVSAVYGFFSYSVGPDAAEDLTAATFERVVRSWAQFDATRSSERTWIFTIARNLLTDHWRWRSHRGGPSLDANPELVESLASSDDPLARSLERDALKGWLEQLESAKGRCSHFATSRTSRCRRSPSAWNSRRRTSIRSALARSGGCGRP